MKPHTLTLEDTVYLDKIVEVWNVNRPRYLPRASRDEVIDAALANLFEDTCGFIDAALSNMT